MKHWIWIPLCLAWGGVIGYAFSKPPLTQPITPGSLASVGFLFFFFNAVMSPHDSWFHSFFFVAGELCGLSVGFWPFALEHLNRPMILFLSLVAILTTAFAGIWAIRAARPTLARYMIDWP